MVQYISRNIVTDTMRENEERNRQLALQEMERRNRQAQDQLARGIAGIYAEGAPQPAIQTSTETNYGIAPARSSIGLQMPAGNEFGLQRGKSLSGFIAPSEIPTEREVTQTVPAAQDTRAQRAMQLATQTPGGGQLAMQMAQSQMSGEAGARKERENKLDKVHEMISQGNIQGAQQYAQMYGLNEVMPLFKNPRALATVQSLGSFAHKQLGLDGTQAAAFSEAALQAMSQGASYEEAFAQAYSAIRNMPGKIAHVTTDDAGNIHAFDAQGRAVQVQGAKGKATRSGGAGGAGSTVQRSFADAQGNMWAVMKDGSTKQLVDGTGNPIMSNEISRFAGQVYLKSADLPGASVEAAQQVAGQLYPGQQPTPQSNASSGKVRRYVLGKGFVD